MIKNDDFESTSARENSEVKVTTGNSNSDNTEHILMIQKHFGEGVEVTLKWTPDKLWKDLGICNTAPTLLEAADRFTRQYTFTDYNSRTYTLTGDNLCNNSLDWNENGEPGIRPIPFLRYRDQLEQQLALEFKTYADLQNGRQMVRNAMPMSNQYFWPIVNTIQFRPDVTTYNIMPYMTCIQTKPGNPGHGLATVGLNVWSQEYTQPQLNHELDSYWPVLTDYVLEADIPYWMYLARWVSLNCPGRTLVLVMTDAGHINDALLGHVAVASAIPSVEWVVRQMSLLTHIDQQACVSLQYILWFQWRGNAMETFMSVDRFWRVPEYNFAEHLISYLSHRNMQVEIQGNWIENSQLVSNITFQQLQRFLGILFYQRKLDFYCKNFSAPGITASDWRIWSPFTDVTQTIHNGWNTFIVRDIIPCWFFQIVTGKKLLAPEYQLGPTHGIPVVDMARSDRTLYAYIQEGQQPAFIPPCVHPQNTEIDYPPFADMIDNQLEPTIIPWGLPGTAGWGVEVINFQVLGRWGTHYILPALYYLPVQCKPWYPKRALERMKVYGVNAEVRIEVGTVFRSTDHDQEEYYKNVQDYNAWSFLGT